MNTEMYDRALLGLVDELAKQIANLNYALGELKFAQSKVDDRFADIQNSLTTIQVSRALQVMDDIKKEQE